jgi:amino acid adenylation domain-containing protein
MDTATVAGFRLSPQQRRLWQLHPDGPPGAAQIVIDVAGELDAGRLRRAAAALVARHDTLRTVYRRAAGFGLPLQVLLEQAEPAWRELDLGGLPAADPAANPAAGLAANQAADLAAGLAAVRREERRRGRDLGQPPILALCLARLGPRSHCLVATLPALAADLRTLGILMRELAALYDAAGGGTSGLAGLGEEVTQYLQFSEWQLQLLEEGGGPAGPPPADPADPAHPADTAGEIGLALARRRRPGLRQQSLAVAAVPTTPDLAAGLRALARRRGVPEAAVLLAAWQTLLARLGGRRQVVVAAPFDGRKYAELQESCGLLSKWLPVSGDAAGAGTFADQVGQAANALAEAASWQEYFIATEGQEIAAAAFEAFAWPAAVAAAGARFSATALRCEQESFALVLRAVSGRGGGDAFDLGLLFDPERFDRDAAEYLAARLACLLEEAAAAPETPLAALDLLGPAERRRLASHEEAAGGSLPEPLPFETLFARQAARTPAAVAASCAGEEMTYGELAARAAILAAHLRRLGVGADVLVPICVPRSLHLLVAILGVLAAGGAYVPLDPGQPPARLARLLAEVRPPVVLVPGGAIPGWLPAGVASLAVDGAAANGEAAPEAEAAYEAEAADAAETAYEAETADATETAYVAETADAAETSAAAAAGSPGAPLDSLAYVIYTSGSTGAPKGVMMSRRGLANYLGWAAQSYDIAALGGAVAQSPAGFDLAVTSLLGPLAAGGRVVLAREEAGLEEMAGLLAAAEVGLFKLTPSLAATALELLPDPLPARRRVLVLGGEALPPELVASWRRRDPGARLLNEYGPTEAAVGCAVHDASAGDEPGATVPIGRPIGGMRLRVLDTRLERVPAGAVGELFIGGAGLARGYLGRPDLTAELFVPDPWSALPGERLYRSGDRVRARLDGAFEFLGRGDEQVKVRGWRVEPAEVASALERHPAVAAAAVVARAEDAGYRLEAYFTARGAAPEAAELRDHLRRELPEYMVPGVLVALPALPLTANGKVDREALLARAAALQRVRESVYVAPESDLERRLTAIWQEVLRVEQVGVADNFFDLGGHSLLMVQVFSRIKAQIETSLLMVELFEFPTVAAMARRLAGEAAGQETAPAAAGAGEERAAARLAAVPQADLRVAARRDLGDG